MPAQDRSPSAYEHISVQPLSGALGAEIHGVDLSNPVSDEVFTEIHRAFLDHLVIFFREQQLDPNALKEFAARFGPLDVHSILKPIDGHPEVLPIFTEADHRRVYADGWHTDVTYQEKPTLGAVLYALDVPDVGGDTLFSNQYLAYQALSPGMREMLDKLTAVHSAGPIYGGRQDAKILKGAGDKAGGERAEHPVIRTHPETGRRSLFLNEHFTVGFKDMTDQESTPLLQYLLRHAIRPEFTSRFRWQKRSVAMWDNRCTLHCPVADYRGHRRHMHRVVITGDRPTHV